MHLIRRIVPKSSGKKWPRCWETWCGEKRNENAKDITSRTADATCATCKAAMLDDALAGNLNVSWI
jgi:hypothetical protein